MGSKSRAGITQLAGAVAAAAMMASPGDEAATLAGIPKAEPPAEPDLAIPAAPIESIAPKPGHAFLLAPDGVAAASFAGQSFAVDKEGAVEVPVAAIPALAEHGFLELGK